MDKELNLLIAQNPSLAVCKEDIAKAFAVLRDCFCAGGKLLLAGNGGSAADCSHIVGELMKSFILPRPLSRKEADALEAVDQDLAESLKTGLQGALPAIDLSAHTALTSAFTNDCDPLLTFAQQVNGYGKAGDVLMCLSTSGNSKNILYAAAVAKAKGLRVVGMTGQAESKLSALCDVCIRVPQAQTYRVQELHLPVYHSLCLMLENHFFG